MTSQAEQKVYDFLPREDFPLVETCVILRQCPQCTKKYNIKLSVHDYTKWTDGKVIQSAFPYLNIDQREMIQTGIHTECWNGMFGPQI